MPWYKDKFLVQLLAVFAFAKAVLFLYIYFSNPLGEQALIFPDSLTYVYPAQTFLTYGQFWEAVSSAPMLLRTPGYPLFLALIQLFLGNATWSVAIVQNLLSVLLLLPVYLTARELSGQTAARISAVLTAISVLYFSLSFAVLTEMLCAFLLAWFVYFAIRFIHLPRVRSALLCAIFLAAAIYVRPAAYYYTVVAGVCFLCLFAKEWKKIIFAFLLPLLMMLGIWHLRNFCLTGYSGFSTVNAYNLYFWNEDFVALKYQISIPKAHELLQENLPKNLSQYPVREQVKIYRTLATPWLKSGWKHKLLSAPKWAGKTLLGTNFVHTSRLLGILQEEESSLAFKTLNQTKNVHADFLKQTSAKAIFTYSLLQISLLSLLGALGVITHYKKHPKAICFLVIYCLYFWAVGSVFFGAYARFRAPFEFALCILSAAGAVSLWERLQAKRKRIN